MHDQERFQGELFLDRMASSNFLEVTRRVQKIGPVTETLLFEEKGECAKG